MGRTLIVGDLHGCAGELDDMLRHVAFDDVRDRLVLVGDLVARGPDSLGVVERAIAHRALAVRGNHDEKVLSWWRVARDRGPRDADKAVKLSERHRAVVESFKPAHFERLASFPLILPVPEHGLTVVHAGVDPRRDVHEADEDVLLTVRSVDERGEPTRKLLDTPWARTWRGPTQVVFGHDARRNLQLEPYATGLDTGCCYGRQLTGILLDAGQRLPADVGARRAVLVSVPARQTWCPTGTGDGPE